VVNRIDFTIITAVYNGERWIAETINSVLANLKNFKYEYIVVNDGSSDNTLKILKQFSDKIKIINQENLGESAAVNVGLLNAKGEYILVVSADDPLISPELFTEALERFRRNLKLVAIYPDWQIINENGSVIKIIKLPNFTEDVFIGLNQVLPGPGTIFRLMPALKIGGRSVRWKFVGDFDFWLRLSLFGEIEHIPKILAQWRNHDNSTSIKFRGLEMAQERILVMKNFLENNPMHNLKYGRKALSNAYYLAAKLNYFDSRINGKKLIIKSFYIRKKWVESAKILEILYIFFLPFSQIFKSLIEKRRAGYNA